MSLKPNTARMLEERANALPEGAELKQNMLELMQLYDMMQARPKPRTFIELGVYHGASLFMLASMVHPEGLIIGVDVFGDVPQWGSSLKLAGDCVMQLPQETILIQGTTTDVIPSVKEYLDGRKVDWLHIDAGHSYGCVSRDLKTYQKFLAKDALVQLHDITHAAGVMQLWDELRQVYGPTRCMEIGNIGLLTHPGGSNKCGWR